MAVDDIRLRTRRELEQMGLSVESASYLVDDRPPGGWDSLVTKETLDLRLEVLEQRLRAEIAGLGSELRKEMRDQTWRLTGALLATVTIMTAIMSAMLRFT